MIPTFDIWLEDSHGRQFRRSNHYHASATFRSIVSTYRDMIILAHLDACIDFQLFKY